MTAYIALLKFLQVSVISITHFNSVIALCMPVLLFKHCHSVESIDSMTQIQLLQYDQACNFKLGQFNEKPAFKGCFSKGSKHISDCQMSKISISFSWIWLAVDVLRPKLCEISVQICILKNWTPVTFK